MIEFSGIEFRQVDNRVMSLRLVQLGLSGAAMFDPTRQGAAAVRGAATRRRAGRARQLPARVSRQHRHAALRARRTSSATSSRARAGRPARERHVIELMEITMRNLREEGGEIDRADFLARADMLAASGKTVLISDYFEYYRLAAYLGRYTKQRIGITMGAAQPARPVRREVLRRARGRHPRVVRPAVQERSPPLHLSAARPSPGELTTVETCRGRAPAAEAVRLPGRPRPHQAARELQPRVPGFFSRDVARRIKTGDPSWESEVPPEIAEVIRRRGLFGSRKVAQANP